MMMVMTMMMVDNDDGVDKGGGDDDGDSCFAFCRSSGRRNKQKLCCENSPSLFFSSDTETQNPPNHATSRVSGGQEPKYRVDVYLVHFC